MQLNSKYSHYNVQLYLIDNKYKAKRFRDMGYRYRSDTAVYDPSRTKEAASQDLFDIA